MIVYAIYSYNHVRMTHFTDATEAYRFLALLNRHYTTDLYYLTLERIDL